MASQPKKVYWDACAWIGLINAEANKIHPLRAIWEDAQEGKYEIWTSAYVYLEVFKGRAEHGDPYPPAESDVKVEEILSQPYVNRVQLDVPIARQARHLRRSLNSRGLKSRPDAIHLATAVYWNLEELHTWDQKHLLLLNGHVNRRDGQPLVIRIPGPEVLGPLFAPPETAPHAHEPEAASEPLLPRREGNDQPEES